FSAVLNIEALRALLELQEELAAVRAWVEEEQRNVTLKDVCYAPLNARDPAVEDCCVNSPTQYFQNNRTRLHATAWDEDGNSADWRDHIMYC
ncbi:NPCL1 protein, partial [Odontophorus gujanensis]|nr:NPCL1 protein [Odontophorus gujanensis]